MPTVNETLRRRAVRALAISVCVLASACGALAAQAEAAVEWNTEVYQAPTNIAPGARGTVRIHAANAGNSAATAWPTISFQLPAGVSLATPNPDANWSCSGSPTITCTNALSPLGVGPYQYAGPLGAGFFLNLTLAVDGGATEGSLPFDITLSGGGGATVVKSHTITVGATQLPFGFVPGSFKAGAFTQAGADYTQAGGHPYQASTSFKLNTHFNEPATSGSNPFAASLLSKDNPKDFVADLPAGFIGDPTVGPKCPTLGAVFDLQCPAASQVGIATISPPLNSGGVIRTLGIYNVEPQEDTPAQFAFRSPVGNVVFTPFLRSDGDMGLSAKVKNVTQADVILSTNVTLWGIPSDPSHDNQRCARPNGIANACVGTDEGGRTPPTDTPADAFSPHTSSAARRAFLTNPTACPGTPVTTSLHASSWENPGSYEPDGDPDLSDPNWVTAIATSPPVTGCSQLQFDPEITVQPTTTAPGAPTGLDFELKLPQNGNPDGLATAHLRDTVFQLPEGMRVNASSADGLAACSADQIGLVSKSPTVSGSSDPLRFDKLEPSCPLQSKLGTVEVDTPLLEEALKGDIFLARQADNPFNSLLGVYLVVRGPGLLVKLAGHVRADAETGQLTTTVVDNPQVPFDTLRVHLKGGPRAPLTTPSTCGVKTAKADMSSWAGHELEISDSFTIDCPGNADVFDPGFSAGSTSTSAGSYSPFVTRITRDVGKELGRVDVKMPKGLLANLRNVSVCSDAEIASSTGKAGAQTQSSPSCPANSQIGTTTVGAGSGPPFFTSIPGLGASGRVFLSEAHTGTQFPQPGLKQTAYGLAIEVPAVAGPFDLGTVMVRAAIYIDPETGQLTVVSDRLPRVLTVDSGQPTAPGSPPDLDGIVLDVRDVRVDIDRKDFSTTPTSCAEHQIVADIRAQDGTLATRSSRYQVGDCGSLALAPRTAMTLVGKRQTKLGGNPALRVRVRQARGQSNISSAKAVLPRTLALDARNASGDWLCDFEAGKRGDCPATSQIGEATAWSPLLKRPVSGPVYFVKNVRVDPNTGNRIRTLPTLLMKLSGEAEVWLRATSASRNGLLISTFKGLPDAQVSRFDLEIKGGASRGILAVTGRNANLCNGKQITKLTFGGQNGKRHTLRVNMKTPCAKKGKKARKGR